MAAGNRAGFRMLRPGDATFEVRAEMTLADWEKAREALNKGKEGHYGPALWLIEAIDRMVRQAKQTFEPGEQP